MIINIQDDILKLNNIGVLDKLLVDKTTKKNIVWATDAYNYAGEEYDRSKQITVLSVPKSPWIMLKEQAKIRSPGR